jgi:hypothetical protein
MSHQERHDPHCEHGGNDGERREGQGPDTRFLDFELDKVMFQDAESLVREAFRELLKDDIKARLRERWNDRIKALAELATDELIADVEANFEIQARIEARNEARKDIDARVRAIVLGKPAQADESSEG